MSRQPGAHHGAGEEPGSRLPGFADGDEWDTCLPSADLAATLQAVSGPQWRCPGADHDQLLGLLRQWQALESWTAAGKLGVLRALIREDDKPSPGGGYHDDLPDSWSKSLTHEVALTLALPPQSAENLMGTAWDLGARLPETGALLARGTLTLAKARAVDDALAQLSEEDAAKAEAMIVSRLPGKTYGQTEKLAVAAALTVDPESATRRREDAERNRARVVLRRDPSGAASLSGYDLPTDETLAAHANVCARAACYKDSAAFAGVRMDQLRALAYLDLMNGVTAEARIASGQPSSGLGAPHEDGPDSGTSGGGSPAPPPGQPPSSPSSPQPPVPQPPVPRPAPLADLIIPLSTLLGLTERPGEGHALGPLDPNLCRSLAATAVNSPHTTLCVTITDPDGIAIGHGCVRPDRRKRTADGPGSAATNSAATGSTTTGSTTTGSAAAGSTTTGPTANSPPGPLASLPARVNLTVAAARLPELFRRAGPARPGHWRFARTADPGPPGGFGTWELTLPAGRILVVKLEPVPTFSCDHRHQSQAYQPNDTLRHLVQVRDSACTFPTCSRAARESDFEHAIPYDKGGATCACNAGARSRACHQVKQSPGWNVTQPRPGWHQWTTPSGRVFVQEPKRYPF